MATGATASGSGPAPVGRVAVVVLGEIARSPRMQYHAVSLANQAFYNVDLVGFSGGECWPEITSNPKIQQHYIRPVEVPTSIAHIYVLEKLYKVFFQIFYLFWALMTIPRPDFILVQTPPAIPILHIAILVSWLRWCKLVIDWHNYGFTILQVSGKANWIVSLYYFYESFFGRFASYHFCVSNTMKEDIRNKWNINAIVLYDRPPEIFKPASLVSQHRLFLKQKFGKTPNPLLNAGSSVTAFTKKEHREIEMRKDRPVLIVSSTSWTADEDFEILFSAMRIIDNYIKGKFQIRLVITGKGDMRAHYESIIQNLNLTHTKIYTAYLSYEDYITLLGSADIGICLHYSSSGVDLPMKIVDMYGCHLPTCAYSYKALPELVKNEVTGFVFKTAQELSDQIWGLLANFPETQTLNQMRKNIANLQKRKWDQEWQEKAYPIFKKN